MRLKNNIEHFEATKVDGTTARLIGLSADGRVVVDIDGLGIVGLMIASKVTPSGTIDGANVTFTIPDTPSPAGTEHLFQNGVLLYGVVGAGAPTGTQDYRINGQTITMAVAPKVGDRLEITYWH